MIPSVLSGLLLLVSDGTGFVALPQSVWIAPGSVIAVCEGDTLAAVPSASGRQPGLRLSPAPAAGDTVLVYYEPLPIHAPNTLRLDPGTIERLGGSSSAALPAGLDASGGLVISGVKRLGVSLGEGSGIDQSTRLSIGGSIAGGIEVEGSITDENLPMGAGSSELVSELDKVVLSVTGARWQARLGDIDIEREGTGPLAYRREMSGIRAGIDSLGPGRISGGTGITGESHQRVAFYTQEGVQGPYDISSGDEIVAGSERVYLDGVLMSRGAAADYTIDYAAGLLTFTSRRLVRRDQRVEATFYRRGDGYRTGLWSAEAGAGSGGFDLELMAFSETDDRDRPLGFALSEEAIGILEASGEDPDSAWVDGAEYVGDGEGSYSLDSLGHWEYAGPDLGDWRVTFSRPPDGPGDYIYDSVLGGFLWVGAGAGTHLPRQYLEIPESLQVGGVTGTAGAGGFTAGFTAAVSRRTGNTYNPDATTREGSCTEGLAGLELGGGVVLGARALLVSDGFRQPGVWESDSSLYSWALPSAYEGRDDIFEITSTLGPASLTAGTRLISTGGSLRRMAGAFQPDAGLVELSAGATAVVRSGTGSLAAGSIYRASTEASLASGTVRPLAGLAFQRDAWPDSLEGSRATGTAGAALSSGRWEGLLRIDYTRDWRESAVPLPSRTVSGRIEASGGGDGTSARMSFEHSYSRWDAGGSMTSDAISASVSTGSGGAWAQAVYSGSGILGRSLEVHYRYAGEGEGSYGYDEETGEYYPDPDGDWEVYYTPGEAGDLRVQATLDADFTTGGVAGPGLDGSVSLESTGGDDRLEAFLLAGAFGKGPGGYSAEVSPFLRSPGSLARLLRVRLRVGREMTEYSGAGERVESERMAEGVEGLDLSDWLALDLLERVRRTEEDLYETRRIDEYRGQADPSIRSQSFSPGLLLGLEKRIERVSGSSGTLYEIEPHLTWNRSGWSSYGSMGASFIESDSDVPLWLFGGMTRGSNLSASARITRTVASGLEVSLTYYGRRIAGSEWTHRGGLDGTVTF